MNFVALNSRLSQYGSFEIVKNFNKVRISNDDFAMLAASMEVIQDPINRDLACLFPADGEATYFIRFWDEAARVVGTFGEASAFGASRNGIFLRDKNGTILFEYRDAPSQTSFCSADSFRFSVVFCRFQALLNELRADQLELGQTRNRAEKIVSFRASVAASYPEVGHETWQGKPSYWHNILGMLIEGEYQVGRTFPCYADET